MTFGFIGTGNMGGAIAAAAAGKAELWLHNRTAAKAALLAEKLGGKSVSAVEAAKADFVFLGVKPYQAEAVLGEISPALRRSPAPVLVSMLAGVRIAALQAFAGFPIPVIRIMPNIPVAVGEGLILYDLSAEVTDAQEAAFLAGLSGAGRLSRLEEPRMDAGSAVSGCGPAFAALFAEALADGGVACGLPRAQATEYALQMLLGSAKYLLETGQHPGQLKDAVCSPGGTTIRGVLALERGGFRAAAMEAVMEAYQKTIGG